MKNIAKHLKYLVVGAIALGLMAAYVTAMEKNDPRVVGATAVVVILLCAWSFGNFLFDPFGEDDK